MDLGSDPGDPPTFDADGVEPVTFRYDIPADESPSHALATVLSAITGADSTELGPLGVHLDLEAMNELLASTDGGFPLSGSVVLDADGLSLAVYSTEIVGVARREAVDWSRAGR